MVEFRQIHLLLLREIAEFFWPCCFEFDRKEHSFSLLRKLRTLKERSGNLRNVYITEMIRVWYFTSGISHRNWVVARWSLYALLVLSRYSVWYIFYAFMISFGVVHWALKRKLLRKYIGKVCNWQPTFISIILVFPRIKTCTISVFYKCQSPYSRFLCKDDTLRDEEH